MADRNAWPKNVSADLRKWLGRQGVTPTQWWGLPPEARSSYRRSYASQQAKKSRKSPIPKVGSVLIGKTEHPTFKLPPSKPRPGEAGPGEAGGFDPNAFGLGAEGMIADPAFFEFVPLVFMAVSDKLATATMNAVAGEVIGRRLRDDERVRTLEAFRRAEKEFFDARNREARALHARKILGQAQVFPGGEDIPLAPIDPLALAPGEQLSAVGPTSAQIEEARRRVRAGTDFTKEDLELAIRDAIAAESPVEEFGVELREGFEGFMAAIRGRVSQGSFAP